MTNRNRQPGGQPTGGQFAQEAKSAAGVALSPQASQTSPHRDTVEKVAFQLGVHAADTGNPGSASWLETMNQALDEPVSAPMSAKRWLEDKDEVDTFQVTVKDGKITRAWNPGPRKVDTSAATFAELGGSRRDYAGLLHVAHGDDFWVGWDAEMDVLVAYRR